MNDLEISPHMMPSQRYWLKTSSRFATYESFISKGIKVRNESKGKNKMYGSLRLKDEYLGCY